MIMKENDIIIEKRNNIQTLQKGYKYYIFIIISYAYKLTLIDRVTASIMFIKSMPSGS